jgi:parallel beta-helix repeat protein
MVQLLPGDVIQFDCGFFDLTSTLQVTDTEDVLIKGCGKDKTVLSFKNSNTPEGILAVNVHGFNVSDLTVLDTGGNGFELRSVDHGTITNVRAIWSSGGGRYSTTPITSDNFSANNARLLNVPCTHPATQNPAYPENTLGDTTSPDYTVSNTSGRYGIYPVSSSNILIDRSESIGASDAGIYVGQTSTAIIRNSRVAFNVFGFEIENVTRGMYDTNLAECNTGGFLVYDLDGLRQYGDRTIMRGNISRNNNTYNFARPGNLVGDVPSGSGMITLAYDRIDIYNNEFSNNNTGGIIHASYEVFPEGAGRPTEHLIDWYTEGMHIYKNKFVNNGNHLPLPSSDDITSQNLAHLLPLVVGAKTLAACLIPTNTATCAAAGAPVGFRGAHIIWDGLLDTIHADCPYPKDASGNPIPSDERGKPILGNAVPDNASKGADGKACHYNAYKFDKTSAHNRVLPDWYTCIDDDNSFSSDSLAYTNFNGTKGLEALVNSNINPADPVGSLTSIIQAATADPAALQRLPASLDRSSHQCVAKYGKNLPPLPEVVIPPFVRSGNFDPAPTAEQIAALCTAPVAAGQVNLAAAKVNCPTLDQYNLFSNSQDPTSTPNATPIGRGLPFSLNTKLFSDYSVKYRVAYLPSAATYKDNALAGTNATINFPAGTIIAKTFSFRNKATNTEVPMETRLLIKRVNSSGNIARWDGLPYIWGTDASGKRVATLSMIGGLSSASWNFDDVDSGAHHESSTPNYLIPNAGQCLSCHSNEDKEPGTAPIGPKIRNLNGPYRSESDFPTDQSNATKNPILGKNQVQYWCSSGALIGCPATMTLNPTTQVLTNLERLPIFNKAGDGNATDPAKDLEARARAYLEVNCAHCHNNKGYASNTGFYLDAFRAVDSSYGICKSTTATGTEGRGGHTYDIVPASSADSIVTFRTGPTATTPSARMPPLARSVYHDEGNALLAKWIDTVVTKNYTNGSVCGK